MTSLHAFRARVRLGRRRTARTALSCVFAAVGMLFAVVGAGSGADAQIGIPDGTTLRVVNGNLKITEPGTVVDGVDVRGYIYVQADNVTIRRTKVTYGGNIMIRVFDVRGTVIENSHLDCQDPKGAGIGYGNYTAMRVAITGCMKKGFMSDAARPAVIWESTWNGVRQDNVSTRPAVAPPPTSAPPATVAPTTSPPVTSPPVTSPPVTSPPVTSPPVTSPPVTSPPVTSPPVTSPPVTSPPVTSPPVTSPPVTSPPTTVAPPPPPPGGMPSKQWIVDNAGLSNPGALKPSGSVTVKTPGAVVENLDVSGIIKVEADNVTIRNVRVRGTTSGALIQPAREVRGTVIEHCEVEVNVNGANGGIGYLGTHTTVRFCEVSGFADGIKAEDYGLYEYNYIHMYKPAGSAKHLDGLQGSSDTDYTVRYNVIDANIDRGGNAAVFVQAWNGAQNFHIYNVAVDYNYVLGGNYTVYLNGGKDLDGSNPASWSHDLRATGNVFTPSGYRYGLIRVVNCAETTLANNRLENGTPVPGPC